MNPLKAEGGGGGGSFSGRRIYDTEGTQEGALSYPVREKKHALAFRDVPEPLKKASNTFFSFCLFKFQTHIKFKNYKMKYIGLSKSMLRL